MVNKMRICFSSFGILALTACGGAGIPTLNPTQAVLSTSDSGVTLQSDSLDLTFVREPGYDRGVFTGAKAAPDADTGQEHALLFSEGDQTFAALLVTEDDGTISAEAFFDRTADAATPTTGRATLTGTYVSTFTSGDNNLAGPIEGLLSLNADFDSMTITGGVTDRTILIAFGETTLPFKLKEELDIVFPEMDLTQNGIFAGSGDREVPNDEDPAHPLRVTTEVFGVLDGEDVTTAEAVGAVTVETVTNGSSGITTFVGTTREVGTFAIGHK